jgi:pimeloyl-ACP methyl ester carboxylesterase
MESVQNPRLYGKAPFAVAVIHGGPGAGGEMAPVARELALDCSILEPIQTATTLEGQIEELKTVVENHGAVPVTLIGYSWGAWLSYMVAARYPLLVKKLLLVGSGPFEEKYVSALHDTRADRLNDEKKIEFETIINALGNPATDDRDILLARLSTLTFRADTYAPIPDRADGADLIDLRGDIFQNVWEAAAKLRKSGELLEFGKDIQCPVIAIHGDYDPHPADGVEKPLTTVLKDFRFVRLARCGHTPWIEQYAREHFYRVVKEELLWNMRGETPR